MKILNPTKLLTTRLQLFAKNEIKVILYLLYQHKKINKTVYKNLTKSL